MAYTKLKTKLDVEEDERPPSSLTEILDDALDKPAFWYIPLQPSLPPTFTDFKQVYCDLSRYIQYEQIKGVVLVYMVQTGGVLDLKSFKKEDFNLNASRSDFPRSLSGIAQYIGVKEKKFTKHKFTKATQSLTHRDKNGYGPFLCYDKKEDVYRHLHKAVLYASCLAYAHKFFHPALEIFPPEFVSLYCRSKALMDDRYPQRVSLYEMDGYHSSLALENLIEETIKGNVHDQAGNINLSDKAFMEHLFMVLERTKKGKDFVTAVDKNSPPGRPQSLIYSIIAQKDPKVCMIPQLKVEYFKYGIDKQWRQNQFAMAAEAACKWGHFEALESLAQPQGLEEFSFEMLRKAVHGKHSTMVESLLRKRKWTEKQLSKALEWACFSGDNRAYFVLMEFGAKPSQKCIYECGFGGSTDIFQNLLQHDLDFLETFTNGQTILHPASKRGHTSLIEILLQYGIDPNIEDIKGNIALHFALDSGYEEVAEMLLFRGSDPNKKNEDDETPIHKACVKGFYRIYEILLNIGGDIHVVDKRGRTLVHMAIHGKNTDIMQQLLDSGLDPEPVDNDNNTVFHYYALHGQTKLVEKYLDNHPKEISAINKYLWNPLLCSVIGGHFETFAYLYKNGSCIQQENSDGKNAIMLVEDCKALLQERKSSIYLQNFDVTIELGSIDDYEKILNYLKFDSETPPYVTEVEREKEYTYDIFHHRYSSDEDSND